MIHAYKRILRLSSVLLSGKAFEMDERTLTRFLQTYRHRSMVIEYIKEGLKTHYKCSMYHL